MARDYYEILEVERTIDAAGLKSSYRKLAMIHHPDRNGGSEESMAKFKEISEAYTVLSDEQKRAAYDRYGHAGVNGGGGGFGGGQQGFHDVNDIFSQVFGDAFGDVFGGRGGGRQNNGPRRGSDLRYDLEITLEQAYKGAEVEISVPSTLTCETCEGTGAKKGAKPTTCSTCAGQGRVRQANGFFQVERTCPSCGGAGQKISAADVCPTCHGHGQVRKTRTLNLKVPAGVDDGSRIRLTGEGDAGQRGGPRGDLYVFLSVQPHELFERDNLDLLCTVPVPMTVAALGGEIEAPCLVSEACDGQCKAPVVVPAGAQTGKTVRIKGKGMPHLNGRQRGDLVVELFVETPTDLTPRQKELMQELAQSFGESQNPRNSSFAGKAKRFWADILGSEPDSSKETAA
ncbi:molecular chaperone DnaJ [Brevundimonas goettingensis]|uniref:Chaperone protein DnaJ n=1 Tax=Brevundimonas goettingensis TaxID=2774190 RepID=A0A975C0P0_9CAUL|nr:molecular chaperone DnaJ [Brevundimonas goettingensis]QTC90722.1 molecular chaperone DnaJ [Brevundimonas goettingensis]